jgi:ATP-dependent Clp protease ATP-binding subunit ClpB
MVRIDMSEYMERHSVSRLIGAPPGYIGYEEGGQLTEAVRRRPYQIVLLDEVEKASREVTNILLQVFDEGHLTDGQGRRVDFRNTIIIMTSNLGAMVTDVSLSDEENTSRMMDAVRHHFPPEFINRLDEIVTFKRLRQEDMLPIVDIQIRHIQQTLVEQRVAIRLTPQAKLWLAENGYDERYGARPLKRLINRHVLNPLSQVMLAGEVKEGSVVEFDVTADKSDITIIVVPPVDAETAKPVKTDVGMDVPDAEVLDIEEVVDDEPLTTKPVTPTSKRKRPASASV